MARGRGQNKIPHYAGPNSELDRSPQAPAGAQKCHFLPGFAKMHFLAYITQGPQKNGICQENGIGNVFELSEIAETCFGAFNGFWLLVALFLEVRWCPIRQNDRLSW